MASIFGVHAVDLVAEGRFNRMVAWSNRKVVDVPIAEGLAAYHGVEVEGPLVRTARGLDICFGDD
jgi:6-phosphofructokinase 1